MCGWESIMLKMWEDALQGGVEGDLSGSLGYSLMSQIADFGSR